MRTTTMQAQCKDKTTSRGNEVQVHNYKSLFQSTGTARNTEAFTLLHTEAFTHRDRTREIAIFPQFLPSKVHFVRKSCDGHRKMAILPQFLTSNIHFVWKSCDGHRKIAILPQFLTSNVHFVWKSCDGHRKIAILPQFLTSNAHFVRWTN